MSSLSAGQNSRYCRRHLAAVFQEGLNLLQTYLSSWDTGKDIEVILWSNLKPAAKVISTGSKAFEIQVTLQSGRYWGRLENWVNKIPDLRRQIKVMVF